jgi:hypothetical protein
MAVLNVITGPQDGVLKASRTMDERCTQFAGVIVAVPRFGELSAQMKGLIGQIDAAIIAKQASRHTTHVTTEKNARILTFIDDLDDVANVVVDMADEAKNLDWQTIATRSLKTKTKSMSEEGLLAVASEFANFLKALDSKALTRYGIEASEVASIEAQITDIKVWRLKKEVTADQKSLDNDTLASLFKNLKDVKAKMERLSRRFARKSPDFYAAFQKAAVVALRTGSKIVRVKKEPTADVAVATPAVKGRRPKVHKVPASPVANNVSNGSNPTSAAVTTILAASQA